MLFLMSIRRSQSNFSIVFIFFVSCEEKTIIVSFRLDSLVMTVTRTAGAATVCKAKSSYSSIPYLQHAVVSLYSSFNKNIGEQYASKGDQKCQRQDYRFLQVRHTSE